MIGEFHTSIQRKRWSKQVFACPLQAQCSISSFTCDNGNTGPVHSSTLLST